MRSIHCVALLTLNLALATVVWLSGCSKPTTQTDGTPVAATDSHDHTQDAHGGWWCSEHGIPEAECSMCNAKVAADFQRAGDWCQQHDRADSQCFICHPEAKEKF